jgi:putative Ca2+/H+ antiporter (TMEM165/GDT1 family)
MTLSVLLAAFWIIFLTELVGDRSIYTIGSLASRFRPLPVFCGLAVAFMVKMLVAVLAGQALAELPAAPVAALSAATFFATALILWFKKAEDSEREPQSDSRALALSFAAIFFIEWGDIGQITAAMLAARYQSPITVWAGASLALMTKGLLAMLLGVKLRQHVPRNPLRFAAVGLCVVMGLLSVVKIFKG